MPNGKKRKSLSTATRPRRTLGRKVAETPRAASLLELQSNPIARTDLPATPKILVPLNGYVPPGVDLQVVVGTNRMDLRYKLELKDLTVPIVLSTINIPAPAPASNFTGIFAAALLRIDRDYRIRVWVDPLDGGTPPHSDDVVYITTRTLYAWPVHYGEEP